MNREENKSADDQELQDVEEQGINTSQEPQEQEQELAPSYPPPPPILPGPPPPLPHAGPPPPPPPDWSMYPHMNRNAAPPAAPPAAPSSAQDPAPAPSLAQSILAVQLRPAAENNDNNNNDDVNIHNDFIPPPLNSWNSFGNMAGELGAVLRQKGVKNASGAKEQIAHVKAKLEERRFPSFEAAKKFINEAVELQDKMATINEAILTANGWPNLAIQDMLLATNVVTSAVTGISSVEKSINTLTQVGIFEKLSGFWGILSSAKQGLISHEPNMNSYGIPMPFGLMENSNRLSLIVLVKIFEAGFAKSERLDKSLNKFDTKYTVQSAHNYLSFAATCHRQLLSGSPNDPSPSSSTEFSTLLERIESYAAKTREILRRIAVEYNEINKPPSQSGEIDPNRFRSFAAKDSAKPALAATAAKKTGGNFVSAARAGDLDKVIEFLKEQAKIDQEDNTGQTALVAAVLKGKVDVALHLISHGANANAQWKENTVFHMACEGSCGPAVVQALLEKSAKINGQNSKHETPLHVAARNMQCDIIKMLVDRKANVNAKDNVGRTAFQTFALKGDYSVAISAPPQAPMGIELARFLETGDLSDVSFLVEGEIFKAHKLILCAQCTPFRSMLENNWAEKQSNEIVLEDISKIAFRHFLRWIYTNDSSFPPDDVALVLELFALSDKYFVHSLKRRCEYLLSGRLTHENVIAIYSYAKVMSPSILGKACAKYFLNEYHNLTEMEGSQEMLYEILDQQIATDDGHHSNIRK